MNAHYRNRWQPLWDQHKTKIKFLLVGGWNTVFGFLIFILLYKLFSKVFVIDYFAYTTAQIIGTFLSIINAFICHRYFTFKSQSRGKKILFEFFRFAMTYVVLFIIGLILLPFFVEVLKIKAVVSLIILNLIVIVTSYFGHSRFSFKKLT